MDRNQLCWSTVLKSPACVGDHDTWPTTVLHIMSLQFIDLEIGGQTGQEAGSVHDIQSIEKNIEPGVAPVPCGRNQKLAARKKFEIDDLVLGRQNPAFLDLWKIATPRSVESTSACDQKLDLVVG